MLVQSDQSFHGKQYKLANLWAILTGSQFGLCYESSQRQEQTGCIGTVSKP